MAITRCPRCAETLQAGARFCGCCGQTLSQAPAGAADRAHQMHAAQTPWAVTVGQLPPEGQALQSIPREKQEESENERLLIFSDAIVAFALTIAAIPLKVPKDLEQVQKGAFAFELGLYLFGFLLISDLWGAHHMIFHHIKRNTGWLIALNILFLAMIVCVPVGFMLIFIGYDGHLDNPSADTLTIGEGVLLFLGAQCGANVALLLMWWIARASPGALFGARVPTRPLRVYLTWKLVFQLLGFVTFTIAFFLLPSFWLVSLGMCLLFVGTQWLGLSQYRRRHRHDLDLLAGGEDTTRVQLFSDAVFAIAITITVAQIDPAAKAEENVSLLGTYVFSFLILGIYWLLHYRIFHLVRRLNATLILWNFAFLLLIILAFIPARLYTSHMHESRYSLLFSAYQLVTAGVLCVLWQYTHRHKARQAQGPFLLKAQTTRQQRQRLSWVISANPIVFLVLALVAVFTPLPTTLYILVYIALLGGSWLIGHLSTRPLSRRMERAVAAPSPPGSTR